MQIKVTRSFLHQGQPTVIGSLLEVPTGLGRELVAMGRAEESAASNAPAPSEASEQDSAEPQPDRDAENEFTRPRRGRPPKSKE